jgi:hypothetical protein
MSLTYELYYLNTYLGSIDFLTSTGNVITFSFDFGFKGSRSFTICRFSAVMGDKEVSVSGGGEWGGV